MYRGLVSGKEQKYRDNGLRKIFISKVEESFEGLNNTAPFSSLRIFFIFSNNGGEEQSFQHLHFKQFFNRLINVLKKKFSRFWFECMCLQKFAFKDGISQWHLQLCSSSASLNTLFLREAKRTFYIKYTFRFQFSRKVQNCKNNVILIVALTTWRILNIEPLNTFLFFIKPQFRNYSPNISKGVYLNKCDFLKNAFSPSALFNNWRF